MCCDCPGFLGLGSAPAPASTLVSEPQVVPLLLYGPLDIAWICCPQLHHHPCNNGTHSTCFFSTGAHTPSHTLLSCPDGSRHSSEQHPKVEDTPTCCRAPTWPDLEFPRSRNTENNTPGARIFWTPSKYPQNTAKILKKQLFFS